MKDLTPYGRETLTEITNQVAIYFNVPKAHIFEKSREDQTTYKRFIIYHLAHYQFKISVSSIQHFFDHKQHGTVINGLRRISDWIQSSKQIEVDVRSVSRALQSLPKKRPPQQQKELFN